MICLQRHGKMWRCRWGNSFCILKNNNCPNYFVSNRQKYLGAVFHQQRKLLRWPQQALATPGICQPRYNAKYFNIKIKNICLLQKISQDSFREAAKRKMSITSSAATMRVLSVLRHWVTKHGQVEHQL